MKAYKSFITRITRQTEPVSGRAMRQNAAGGYAFVLDDWGRLERFLILGSEGGTYYASERELTRENALCVERCIQTDGTRTVHTIVAISTSRRAPKNDPALFALAMCAGLGDEPTRMLALEVLPQVARIGTDLFHFASFVEQFRGWGRGLVRAIQGWYNGKSVEDLSYQIAKYQQRDGWSHRDLLRLSHPRPATEGHDWLFKYATGKLDLFEREVKAAKPESPSIILGMELAKRAQDSQSIEALIRDTGLTREMIPTHFLNEAGVWDALLEKMPMTAMIRNLATMTRVGLLAPSSEGVKTVTDRLRDQVRVVKAGIHPIAVLAALKTYEQGKGVRGKHSWSPVAQIVDALNDAFYLAFGAITPTDKRWLLALDVSGSMTLGSIAGVAGLTPRVGSAAMALVTAAIEREYHIMAFAHDFIPVSISPRQRLDDVVKTVSNLRFGGTDCALPMVWAARHKVPVDVFAVYTDNETWAGVIHPFQAMREYREKMGIPAKLIVVGMTATASTIADLDDAGMLDVVGFDMATPQLMSEFAIR